MRILKIFDGDFPWDVRVEKVMQSLVAAGHEVVLVCRNRSGRPASESSSPGIRIERLPGTPGRWGFLSFPFFFNPVWIWRVVQIVLRHPPDLVLARDLPIAPLGLLAGWIARVPVVADLAEPYPDSLRTNLKLANPSWVDFVVRNPVLADWVERFVVRFVDLAIVVCPEAGWRLERQGLPVAAWTEVRNTAVRSRFVPKGSIPSVVQGFEGRTLVLFSGLLSHDRGVEVAIEAVERLERAQPGRFALLVVGEGPMRAELAEMVRSRGLDQCVRLAGWMEYDALPDVVANSHVGILPFHDCEHIRASLANKLFEYMSLGLPIIVSDIPVQTRIVKDTRCGLVFPPGDATALADVLQQFAKDPDLTRACGEAGRRAVIELFNWDFDGTRLVAAIEAIHGRRSEGEGLPSHLLGPHRLLVGSVRRGS